MDDFLSLIISIFGICIGVLMLWFFVALVVDVNDDTPTIRQQNEKLELEIKRHDFEQRKLEEVSK